MVLELAVLDIKPGLEKEFEISFEKAQTIISSIQGYVSHQLQHCIERPNRYLLFPYTKIGLLQACYEFAN